MGKTKIKSQEKLTRDIIKSTKAIREKYKKLKLGKTQDEEDLNRTFKPIVEPLQQLVSNSIALDTSKKDNEIKSKSMPSGDVEQKPDDEEKPEYYESETEASPTDDDEDDEKWQDVAETPELEPKTPINLATAQEYVTTPKGYKSATMRSREAGVFAAKYILYSFQPDKQNELDRVFGIRADGQRWLLGKSEVTINDDKIYIGSKSFKGTPGVFELLFMKNPDEEVYTKRDLKTYKQLLEVTDAHKQKYDLDHHVNSNKGYKYKNIIKPLFAKKKGGGFQTMMANKPRYEYWDDPNELVERLRLLLGSQSAGNNNHHNEIVSIIEELKEADIIE